MKALWLLAILLVGCGLVPQKISVSDPEVQTLYDAARLFAREEYGFSPLPSAPDSDIRIERHEDGTYNVMLHMYNTTRRTIAFRRTTAGYQWIHEQESFPGPKMYEDVDGPSREQITLTYGTENVSGHPTNQLSISYLGDDSRLRNQQEISLPQVTAVLQEWGYKK